jgi:DNA-binding response OmpR family regulator
MPDVLIVEDDSTSANVSSRQLTTLGFSPTTVATAQEALEEFAKTSPSLVIIDERLPDDSGTNLARTLRQNYPGVTIVMCTVVDEEAMIRRAFEAGCNYYTVKPNGLRTLCANKSVESILDPHAQELFTTR